MNYRHAYHAGNFADVLKHATLTLVLQYMTGKPQPLRVIDVHAGIARYDLCGIEAGKTGEWRDGIGRLLAPDALSPQATHIIAPYLDAIRALNPDGGITVYPGSPLLARTLMRRGDTLIANELHPEDAVSLRGTLKGLPNTKVLELDAWVALRALLPPPERRGLILIDPPYEAVDEFARVAEGVREAIKRFATGTFILWYPVKDHREVSRFLLDMRGLGLPKALNVSLRVSARGAKPGLIETGLFIVNPPYVLADQLNILLPELSRSLAQDAGYGFTVEPGAAV